MSKLVVFASVATLLVTGVGLLRGLSSETSATARAPAAKIAEAPHGVRPAQVAVAVPLGSAAAPAGTERAEPTDEPATRGPAAPVWKVLGTSHANAAEARDGLLAALKGAPACADSWCNKARTTLEAWSAAIAKKVPGALTPDLVQCGAAGCWLRVTLNEPRKWRDVRVALSTATLEHGWTGPSVLSDPDFQAGRGSIAALWVLLPGGDGESSASTEGE